MSRKLSVPPGVPFLFKLLLIVATPPCVVFGLSRLLIPRGIDLPTWAWILAAVLSGPLALTVRVWSKYHSFRRGAERLGAVMPPEMVGNWIGNWDLLTRILEAFEKGYPCEWYRHPLPHGC